jgi:hypothetical protein
VNKATGGTIPGLPAFLQQPKELEAANTEESVGRGIEGVGDFFMGDEALKGLSIAERMELGAKVAKLAESNPVIAKTINARLKRSSHGNDGHNSGGGAWGDSRGSSYEWVCRRRYQPNRQAICFKRGRTHACFEYGQRIQGTITLGVVVSNYFNHLNRRVSYSLTRKFRSANQRSFAACDHRTCLWRSTRRRNGCDSRRRAVLVDPDARCFWFGRDIDCIFDR